MNTEVQVLTADLKNSGHGKAILDLLSHYATDIMGGGENLSEDVKENLIARLAATASAVIILAYDGETPVGLSICFMGFSTFSAKPLLNIHDFVVTESHRGKGIAKLMLEKLEEIARSKGCCKLTLEVLEGNLRAQKVYHSFGFASYELDKTMGKALFLNKKLV
ncbi:MAG: GNAT family N-acetyltransferase [Cytophagaceae bacterium]